MMKEESCAELVKILNTDKQTKDTVHRKNNWCSSVNEDEIHQIQFDDGGGYMALCSGHTEQHISAFPCWIVSYLLVYMLP